MALRLTCRCRRNRLRLDVEYVIRIVVRTNLRWAFTCSKDRGINAIKQLVSQARPVKTSTPVVRVSSICSRERVTVRSQLCVRAYVRCTVARCRKQLEKCFVGAFRGACYPIISIRCLISQIKTRNECLPFSGLWPPTFVRCVSLRWKGESLPIPASGGGFSKSRLEIEERKFLDATSSENATCQCSLNLRRWSTRMNGISERALLSRKYLLPWRAIEINIAIR